MEIQKNLFKLSEYALQNEKSKKACLCICIFSILLTILSLSIFVIATVQYSSGKKLMQTCLNVQNPLVNELFQKDVIVSIKFDNLKHALVLFNNKNLFLNNSHNNCIIYKNVQNQQVDLFYTRTINLPTVNKDTLSLQQFNNYTILLEEDSLTYFQQYMLGKYQLIINELLQSSFFSNISFYQINFKSENMYFTKSIHPNKLWVLIKTFVSICLLSFMSLLYVYATIISAPAFIISIIDIFKIHNAIPRVSIYKVFPWIGIYMHPLDQYQTQQIKKSSKYISNAIIFTFLLIYSIYFGVLTAFQNILFSKPTLETTKENLLGIIAIAQFCSLLFIRTRTSIKYFPLVFILLQWAFVYYCCVVDFGYKNWLLSLSMFGSLTILTYLILQLEIPAFKQWNKQMLYTPTHQRPRTLYLAHYNLLWNNDIPDLEIVGVPVLGRSQFLPQQLYLVDENYTQLGQIITANQQQ